MPQHSDLDHKFKGGTAFWVVYAVVMVLLVLGLDLIVGRMMIPQTTQHRTIHTYYHHGLKKNVSTTDKWGQAEYPFYTNSLGFRDASARTVSRKSGDYRLLLMGDSFTEGVGLPFEQTFAGIIADRLDKKGIEVLNAGVTSYSPRLFYLKLKYLFEEKGLKVDEVAVFMDISDIQDEIFYSLFRPYKETTADKAYLWAYQHSFLFRFFLSKWVQPDNHGRVEFTQTAHDQESYKFDSDQDIALFVEKLKNSTEVRYPKQVASKDYVNWFIKTMEHWWGQDVKFYQERGRWTVDPELLEKWGHKGLDLAARDMDFVLDLCKKHHVRLSVTVYPWPDQVAADDPDSIQVRFWKDYCAGRGIGFADMFPVFINGHHAIETIGEYYIHGDSHWNAKGHRLVAEEWLSWYGKKKK